VQEVVCFGHISESICFLHGAALQASTIAIIAFGGRLPQIMLNARRGNSGELSPLTSILNLAGNVARLFTTAVLTKVRLQPRADLHAKRSCSAWCGLDSKASVSAAHAVSVC
jgi:hypothetical protein